MGFGMQKEVYTRKPKKAFKHLKKIYCDELDQGWDTKYKAREQYQKLTEQEKLLLREKIKSRLKAENKKRVLIMLISLVGTVLFMAFLVWFIRWYIGF